MTKRALVLSLVAVSIVSLLGFAYVLRQLSFVSVGVAAHDEIEEQLRQSLDDQKKLARLDRDAGGEYRKRFEEIADLRRHLQVVQLNRLEVARRIEEMIFVAAGFILLSGIALYFVERRERERRLAALETALGALSRGEGEITLGEKRRDVIGRIAAAIERTSRTAADDRRRLRYLEHLSAWQEAARRHAHEMRTPLTAARMDVERFSSAVM
jgi:signal transduction histidine kinase